MKSKVELGNSGIKISPIGLGCMGMSEFYGDTDKTESKKVLTYAIDCGVNFLDTADAYAYGDNELLVGEVVHSLNCRDDLVIATKCGIIRDKNDTTKRGVSNSPDYIKKVDLKSVSKKMNRIFSTDKRMYPQIPWAC